MKAFFVLLWVACLASQAASKLVPVNGILKIKLRTDTKHVADGPVVATVEADSIVNNLMSIRGGAKSPVYLLYRKLSRILRPYLPKSWRKPYSFGTSHGSVKKGRYGKGKEQKSGAKGNRDSTSASSGLVKYNRLQKEIQEFISNPPDNCKLKINGNIRNWEVTLTGVKGTVYEGEVYKLKMIFPKDYPAKPPSVYFLKPCPKHVHVYTNGDICLNFLGRDWRPTMTGQMLAYHVVRSSIPKIPGDAEWTEGVLSEERPVVFPEAGTTVPPEALQSNLTSSTCGGNCPGGCSSCPCGTTTSYQDIAAWCSKYSWNQANCQCIMKHESGGNANAVNQNSGGSFDVGLWQVNSGNWASCSGGKAPCGTSTNLECAKDVYNWGGKTWKFWSTCSACGCCGSA